MAKPIRVEFKLYNKEMARCADANITKITEKIQEEAIKFVYFVQESVVKPHTPTRTGRLRASIDSRLDRRSKSRIIIRCYAGAKRPVKYAWFVEHGTKKHYIYPNQKSVLKFEGTNRSAGGTVYTRKVKHPGSPGFIMFQKGLIVIKTHLPKLLVEGIKSLPFADEIRKANRLKRQS